jgi:hypothetical protein
VQTKGLRVRRAAGGDTSGADKAGKRIERRRRRRRKRKGQR